MPTKLVKNIFAYSGSGNNHSTCSALIRKIVADLKADLIDEISIKEYVHTPNNTLVNNCKGCGGCFLTGRCSLDYKDDMKKIKEEMITADVVILATPVYVHNVSGDFKVFMDRLAYWTHLFRLLGKPVYFVISTSNSGIEIVENMLKSFSTYLGMDCLGTSVLTERNHYSDLQYNEHYFIIKNALLGERTINLSADINRAFIAQKLVFQQYDSSSPEYQYWKENHFFDVGTLKELLS